MTDFRDSALCACEGIEIFTTSKTCLIEYIVKTQKKIILCVDQFLGIF